MMDEKRDALKDFCRNRPNVGIDGCFADGTVFGDWRLTAFIGRGGSGEVYCAEHVSLGTSAAVKVLVRADERARARFEKEAKLLSCMKSLAFPRFFAYGEANGTAYLAMELLEPGDLPHREKDVADFLVKVCEGVAELHSKGFVHRDIKPGNILYRTPENGRAARPQAAAISPVICDLGLVKEISVGSSSVPVTDATQGGVGTPGFGAPEQMERGEATTLSDIHALGVLADRCFESKPPWRWRRIIERATSSIPGYRYPYVGAFARAIQRWHLLRNVVAILAGVCSLVVLSWFIARITSVDQMPSVVFSSAYAKWDEISVSTTSNGIIYTTVNLCSNRHEIAELMAIKGPQVLTINGPGQLLSAISGPSNVIIRLNGCYMINRTRVPYPQNAISYVLDGGSTSLDFGFQFYPTNLVRGASRTGPYVPNDTSGTRMTFRR